MAQPLEWEKQAVQALKQDQPEVAIQLYQKTYKSYKKSSDWTNVVRVSNLLVKAYLQHKQIEAARDHLESFFASLPDDTDANIREIARAHTFLGVCYRRGEDCNQALGQYRKAMDLQLEHLGSSHMDLAITYNSMGLCDKGLGNFRSALKNFLNVQQILVANLGPMHLKVADSYNNIGTAYQELGNYDSATWYYSQALINRIGQLGPIDLKVAQSYNNLGVCKKDMGEYQKALDFFKQALDIRVEKLGSDHIKVAQNYGNMGSVYLALGQYEEALKHHRQALDIRQRALGDNLAVDHDRGNIAVCFEKMGQYEDALELAKTVLDHRLDKLGTDHPKVAESHLQIGHIHMEMGNYKLAEDAMLQGLDIRLCKLGNDHPEVAEAYSYLGKLAETAGNNQRALSYFQYALQLRENKFGKEHPKVAEAFQDMGIVYMSMGELDTSQMYFNRARQLLNAKLGSQHPQVASLCLDLGDLFEAKGLYDSSDMCYRKAMEIQTNSLGTTHPDLAKSWGKIGANYKNLGQYNEAFFWLNKALDLSRERLGKEHPLSASLNEEIGVCYFRKGEHARALDYFTKTLKYRKEKFGNFHPSVANSYSAIGIVKRTIGQYDSALHYYQLALEIFRAKLGEDHITVGNTYSNIGVCLRNKGYFDQALDSYRKALTINLEKLGEDHPQTARCYNNMAVCYYHQGDYGKAIEHLELALDIRTLKLGERHPLVADSYTRLALGYLRRKDKHTAEALYRKGLEIQLERLGEIHPRVASTYNDLGDCLTQMGRHAEALTCFRRAMDIYRVRNNEFHPDAAKVRNNIGQILVEKGAYTEALSHYKESLAALQSQLGSRHPEIGQSYLLMAEAYRQMGKFEEADKSCSKGIEALLAPEDSLPQENSLLEKWVSSKPLLLKLLREKGNIQVAFSNPDDSLRLKNGLAYFITASKLVDSMRLGYTSTTSQQVLTASAIQLYEDAIGLCLKMEALTGNSSYLDQAFLFSEKSRSIQLLASLNEHKARSFAGIPESLLEKERLLRADIGFWEREIRRLRRDNSLDSVLIKGQHQLLKARQTYRELTQLLESQYPRYFQLKYAPNVVSVGQVQKYLLTEDAIFVEYFIGRHQAYAFVITQTSLDVLPLAAPDSLQKVVSNLLTFVRGGELVREKGYEKHIQQTFINEAHRGWKMLLAPVLSKANRSSGKVIVVPDGVLGYLPLDILVKDLEKFPDYRKLDYVLRNHEVQYVYSANLFLADDFNPPPSKGSFLGFAPSYSSDTSNYALLVNSPQPLANNQSEIAEIQQLLGGETLKGSEATKQRFKEEAHEHQVLHFAMHAQLNDQEPMYSGMWFAGDSSSNELLRAYEIYEMEVPAELAVLSACNSGNGKLLRGEGIMSLAHAFRFAGCKSITMSLWTAEDIATAQIMKSYYEFLKSGKSKSEALRQAKLDYLETAPQSHPYFWAAFVSIGTDVPLQFSNHWQWPYLLAGLGFLLGAAVITYKRRQQATG
ncbi:MAG: tetratricopeptide repeat protein [Bacteroidota bacterium]